MCITTARLELRNCTIKGWLDVSAYQRDPGHIRLYPWTDSVETYVRDFATMYVDRQWEKALEVPSGDHCAGQRPANWKLRDSM